MIKLNSKEIKIWFISDTHYGHTNIVSGVSRWSDIDVSCRQFNTVEEMSQHLVGQINKYVGEDDILFHLGDWSFGGIENIWNFRKQIKCKNIHLILGNHDKHILLGKKLLNCYCNNDGEVENGKFTTYGDWRDDLFNAYPLNLFESIQKHLEVIIDGTLVIMNHYPLLDFHMNEYKEVIDLFGHVHGKIPHQIVEKSGFRIDVGVDNAFKLFGEYKPFSWEEIIKLKNENNSNI